MLDLVDRVLNQHDASAIAGFTNDVRIQETARSLLIAFPDIECEVVWSVAEADRVVSFVSMTGTHQGPWLMVQEATHLRMRASFVLALQFDRDGMVVDSWLGPNFIAMLAQLGWGVAPTGQVVPPL